jgi:uncharacterized protein (DUF1778 family)
MPSPSPAILSLRVSPAERDMLQSAARQARTNISDFVRRKALEAAEAELVNYPVVVIPAQDWENFEAWVNAPGRDVPALRALAEHDPAWRD